MDDLKVPKPIERNESFEKLVPDAILALTTTAAVIVADAEGRIEWVNPAFTAITGYTIAEVLGKRPGQVLQGPDSDPQVVAQMSAALRRHCGFEADILNYHKNGSQLWLHLTVDPVLDDAGNLVRFIGVETDVTARRQAEQSLRLANSQLAATLESTTDGIMVTDLQRNLVRVNQRFKQMWGISDEIVDAHDDSALWFIASQMKDPATAVAMVKELYACPDKNDFSVLVLKDGRTFERNSLPQYISGRAMGRVCSFRDVSERTQAEKMQSALHRISEAAHSTQDLISLFGRIHEIIGETMPARNFFVALYDEDIDEVSFPYFVDEFHSAPAPHGLNSGSLPGEVIRSGNALLVTPDTRQDLPAEVVKVIDADSLHWLGVPLQARGKTFGALVVQSYSVGIQYSEHDKALLQFVSEQIASAIERKQADEALRDSEERHRLLADNAEDVIWTLDRDGKRTYISPSVTRLRGYTVAEVMRQTLCEAFTKPSAEEFRKYVEQVRAGRVGQSFRIELEQPCKNGSTVWVEVAASMMANSDGEVVGFLGVSRDISDRKRQASFIEHLAFFDALTGLANRVLFQERLELALAAAERNGREVALLFLDLDRFKEINDSLGHAIGDQALREVARRLQAITRQEETLARLGGDEFVLIAQNAARGTAELIAARMLATMVDPIDVMGHVLHVRGSIGIALFPDDGTTPTELVRHTDIAMYRAKESGGGFRLYQPEMGIDLEQRIRLTNRLVTALEAGQLELFYQPQFSLETGALIGAEALLRWRDGDHWVSPAQFIPLAEERGMMGAIGDWVMRAACAQLTAWQQAGLGLPDRLAVNVSAKQLLDPDFADRMLAIVADAGLTPDKFELELTESSMMADPEGATRLMEALSSAGFTLAIDDFGTGYSSLSYLKRFSVDRIKIDISFIRDMLNSKDDHAIVKAIIAMSDSLGLETIAEGVEDAAQAQELKDLGCNAVQGYHFGRPQPAHIFSGSHLAAKCVDTNVSAS